MQHGKDAGEEGLELDEMHRADPHDSSVREPLISSTPPPLRPTTTPPPPRTRPNRTIYALTLSAGLSGLLFGYDTGVISSTLVSIRDDLSHRPLTTFDKSLITAVTSLFALVSAPTTGYLADKHGRKPVIALASVLFTIGAALQAVASQVWVMVVGRAAVGAAVGLASCATPLYITELAPADLRGRLVTIQSLFITGGQVVAYVVGWALAGKMGGWRWMVGLGAAPAVLQLVLLAMMFETPRWLVRVGRKNKARQVLQRVYGDAVLDGLDAVVDAVIADIEAELASDSVVIDSFRDTAKALVKEPLNRRALTITCMLQGLQQLCGFNSLMYFSATIFLLSGFSSPIGTSLSVALTNFAFTLVAFAYIDSVGRRKILLRSLPFMVFGLFAASLAFSFLDIRMVPGGEEPAKSMTAGVDDGSNGSAWPMVLLISLILYVAAYAIGLGCVPWQQSELFPLRVRSLGSGFATATNWTSNFLIGVTFLPMMELLGASVTFLLYAVVCAVGWACIWRIYPETAGLELEGIGELLKDGWGVKQSVQGFQARRKDLAVTPVDGG